MQDLAGRGGKETGDDVEQRGLAAARCAERHHELVLAEVEVHVVERLYAPQTLKGRELHSDVTQTDDRGHERMAT